MTHHLQASADAFVIRLADEATLELLREEFGQVGSLETLPAHPELALLQLRAGGGDPKRLWRKLQATLGGKGSIMPVFRDAEDAARYPVGDILVRFKGSPSDHLLGEWAAKNGLRVRQRNKYVPNQVAFEPSDPREQYLPDLLERLEQGEDVAAVWPETLGAYRR